jgi:MFS superfamily sulfate permease-like transporter
LERSKPAVNPITIHRADLRGGIEASLRGITTTVAPILLFVSLLGTESMAAGFWATVITAVLVPAVHLLFRSASPVIPGARMASLAAYIGLVVVLSGAAGSTAGHATALNLTAEQLRTGLAAGSLMFMAASALVWLFGLLEFGNVFKMIPMPVTAGISNGTALLLLSLGVHKITDNGRLAAVTAFAMVACFFIWPSLQAWSKRLAFIPAVVISLSAGLLIAMLLEPPFQPPTLRAVPDWAWMSVRLWPGLPQHELMRLLQIGLPSTVTLALVMILETFTAANEMEQRFGTRINPNRELMVLGGSNMISALMGGVPCTGHNSRSISSWLAGGRGVQVALMGLLVTGLLLWLLGPWLLVLPVGMVAGLLLLQCLLMAEREVIHRLLEIVRTRHWRRKGTSDLGFWTIIVITVVEYFGSMIWASFMGIGLSCLVILRRVSGSLTANWNYLDHHRSHRVRSCDENNDLTQQFNRVGVLRLNGHLFFGNSIRLTQLADELNPHAIAVVIDVSQVRDVDPSGLNALARLIRAIAERKLTIVLAGLSRTRSTELHDALQAMPGIHRCIDMDRGLELCEDMVLRHSSSGSSGLLSKPLQENSLLEDLTERERTVVLTLGKPREITEGAALFFKGNAADGVWLLEKGVVSILSGGDESTRLSTLGPGQFLGEMSLIDGKSRSATAQADSPVNALLLDKQALATLTRREPETALKIMRNIAKYLSYRVRSSSALLAEKETSETTPDQTDHSPQT